MQTSGAGWTVLPWADGFMLQLTQHRVELYPPCDLCVLSPDFVWWDDYKSGHHSVLHPHWLSFKEGFKKLRNTMSCRQLCASVCICICNHRIDSSSFASLLSLFVENNIDIWACFSLTKGWFITEHGAPADTPDAELKASQWHPKGALVKPLLQLKAPQQAAVQQLLKTSLCLKVHLLPWDKIQTSIIIIIIACTDDTWQWIARECSAVIWSCWALKWFPKLSNLCTRSDIDYSVTSSMHFGGRWLWSSLTTLTVSLPERSSTKWYNTERTHTSLRLDISRIELRWHVVTLEPEWAP